MADMGEYRFNEQSVLVMVIIRYVNLALLFDNITICYDAAIELFILPVTRLVVHTGQYNWINSPVTRF